MIKNSFCCCFILFISVIAAGKHADKDWLDHLNRHNLNFNDDTEHTNAYSNFKSTDQIIKKHNNDNKQTYKLAHNQFSHWNKSDLTNHKGYSKYKSAISKSIGSLIQMGNGFNGYYYTPTQGYALKSSVDWVQRGFNKPVLDQGNCGNCWAFSVAAAMEGYLFAINKTSVSLSVQELTSCSSAYGNAGCNGGDSLGTYMYANKYGVCQNANYPLTSSSKGKTGTCSFANGAGKGTLYKVKTFYFAQKNSHEAIMEMLDKFGPLSVALDASNRNFDYYSSGIFATSAGACSNKESSLDHMVLLTGYGTDASTGIPYWTIKNQWGSSWGMNGYMKISRAISNNCGIALEATTPIL